MVRHKVITTNREIKTALERARPFTDDRRVVEIHYDPKPQFDLFVLKLADGSRTFIGREKLQGLQNAKQSQIANVEILGNGTGLHWPDLDLDYSIVGLLSGISGNKQWMAEMGRRGGTKKSKEKAAASRTNGLKGGRPRKVSSAS